MMNSRGLQVLGVPGCPRYLQLQLNRNADKRLRRNEGDHHVAPNRAHHRTPKGGSVYATRSSYARVTAPVTAHLGDRAKESVRAQTTAPLLDQTVPSKE